MKNKSLIISVFVSTLLLSGCTSLLPTRRSNSKNDSSIDEYSSIFSSNDSKEHIHTYSNSWSYNDTHHWLETTCEHKDLKDQYEEHIWSGPYNEVRDSDIYTYSVQCIVCGYEKNITIEYQGDIIAEEGNLIIGNDGFYYYANNANGYSISIGENRNKSEITIPNMYNGKAVNKIANDGFRDTSITKVSIPNSIVSIGFQAFEGCYQLMSVDIPSSVQYIGERAFAGCNNMVFAQFNTSEPPYIGGDLFAGTWDSDSFSILVPDDAVSVYKNVPAEYWMEYGSRRVVGISNKPLIDEQGLIYEVMDNDQLMVSSGATRSVDTLINIPSQYNGKTVTTIKERGFADSITPQIILPNTITRIEASVFENCYNLRTLTIPNKVTYIGSYAFAYCNQLTTLYMEPSTPPTIEVETFYGLENSAIFLTIVVSSNNYQTYKTAYSRYLNEYVVLSTEPQSEPLLVKDGLSYYKINDNECSVRGESGATYNNLVIESNINYNGNSFTTTAIFKNAFENCYINSISLPNTLKSIGVRAFNYVGGLTSIDIPSSVTRIDEQAFAWMDSLKTVKFNSITPPTIGSDVFAGTWDPEDFVILVPNEAIAAYKAITAEYWQISAVPRIKGY